MDDAVELLELYSSLGVERVVCTPHYRSPHYDVPVADAKAAFSLLENQLAELGVPHPALRIGAEVHMSRDFEADLRSESFPTLCSSRYVLVEFPNDSLPDHALRWIHELRIRGYFPVMAHPERHLEVRRNPKIMKDLVSQGLLMQITASCFAPAESRFVAGSSSGRSRSGGDGGSGMRSSGFGAGSGGGPVGESGSGSGGESGIGDGYSGSDAGGFSSARNGGGSGGRPNGTGSQDGLSRGLLRGSDGSDSRAESRNGHSGGRGHSDGPSGGDGFSAKVAGASGAARNKERAAAMRQYEKIAWDILANGNAAVIASDSHGVNKRRPELSAAYDAIEARYGESVVNTLIDNANAIWENRPMSPVTPTIQPVKRWFSFLRG